MLACCSLSQCTVDQSVAAAPGAAASEPRASSPADAMIRMALADAAQRTGIAADSLQLVSAERVTWGDGSLGCPRPDMLYTQALVSGWRIRIRAAAEVLDYHAGSRSSRVVFCPAGQSQEPLPGGQTQVLRSRAQAAEAELDGALGASTAALGADAHLAGGRAAQCPGEQLEAG